jgi:hypothetical protein
MWSWFRTGDFIRKGNSGQRLWKRREVEKSKTTFPRYGGYCLSVMVYTLAVGEF